MPLHEIFSKLHSIQIGGCTCNTKTPELAYHKDSCHYRLATEVELALSAPPRVEQGNGVTANAWLVWSGEHGAWWPKDRCGYVPLRKAGVFTFEEAREIVRQASCGMMGGRPNETIIALADIHPVILERAGFPLSTFGTKGGEG